MKLREMLWAGVCLLMASGFAGAGTVSFQLFSTGFSSSGILLSGGSQDGNWELISDPSGSVTTPTKPYVTNGCTLYVICTSFPFPNWTGDTLSSAWISPRKTESGASDPAGEYIYQETFNLTGLDTASIIITGKWTADNYGYIVVNGTPVTTGTDGNIPDNTGEFKSFTNFVLTASNADFLPGLNTIQFDVFNTAAGSPDVTGLDVDFESTSATLAPEPASLTLMGGGLFALGLFARKRAQRQRA